MACYDYLGIVNLVHPANFEAGFNAERTFTTYGSINNIPVSYGLCIEELGRRR